MEERKEEEEKEVSGRRLGREERGRFRERGVGREGEFKEVRWEVKEGE